MITNTEIKNAYDEFDELYEAAEISPYGSAYRYFEAGVRWAEEHLHNLRGQDFDNYNFD